ncbi:unnamed protein product [Mytilus edulis]|uniref:Uncharacterized protein n=1 Tax=Mytilus edulis TaxID=6550 RepID=A0A8S3SIS3_MYTED|nr:unnamed protein product [Mytilus edulis]
MLKAPVHANRLKKFLHPNNRPTNPPNEVDEDHDLNPEELMDMPEILDRVNDTIINHTQNQVGKNNQNDQTQLHKDKQPSQNPNPQQDIYDVERILKCRKRGNIKHNQKDELPIDELPKDELPKDDLPKDELPIDELPKDELPKDDLPKDELPIDEITLQTQIRNVAICARDEHFGEVVENITGRKVTSGTFTIIRKVL